MKDEPRARWGARCLRGAPGPGVGSGSEAHPSGPTQESPPRPEVGGVPEDLVPERELPGAHRPSVLPGAQGGSPGPPVPPLPRQPPCPERPGEAKAHEHAPPHAPFRLPWAAGGRGPASYACSRARRRYWVTLGSPESSFLDNQSGHWQELPRPVRGSPGEAVNVRPGRWSPEEPVRVAGPRVGREASRGTPRPLTVEAAGGAFWAWRRPLWAGGGTEATGADATQTEQRRPGMGTPGTAGSEPAARCGPGFGVPAREEGQAGRWGGRGRGSPEAAPQNPSFALRPALPCTLPPPSRVAAEAEARQAVWPLLPALCPPPLPPGASGPSRPLADYSTPFCRLSRKTLYF